MVIEDKFRLNDKDKKRKKRYEVRQLVVIMTREEGLAEKDGLDH
jgi:hypothetical protein